MFGCADPEGPVGSNIGTPVEGLTVTDVLTPDTVNSYPVTSVNTGGSAYLYVGEAHSINCQSLLRYMPPTYRPYEWRIDSARFEIAWTGTLGDGTFPVLAAEILDFKWIEANPPARDSLPTGSVLTFNTPEQTNNGKLVIPLPVATAQSWAERSDSSRIDSALTLKLTADQGAGKLLRFSSRSAPDDSLKPYLWLFRTVRDSAGGVQYKDTIRILPDYDLFLISQPGIWQTGGLVIGSGAVWRSMLWFDVNSLVNIPDSVSVVNLATLTLYRKRVAGDWLPTTRSILPYRLLTDLNPSEPDSASRAGVTSIATAIDSATTDSIQIYITSAVQTWLRNPADNFGLEIQSTAEGANIDRITFESTLSVDPNRKPKLTIHSTRFPR